VFTVAPLLALLCTAMSKDYIDDPVVPTDTRAPPLNTSLKQNIQWGS